MKEIWKDVTNYEGLYQVSNMGRVKSLDHYINHGRWKNHKKLIKGKILSSSYDKDGYVQYHLYKNNKMKNFKAHRLVAEAFIPNPNNYPIINHKDECKTNNCITNLEWCTHKYNSNYGTLPQRKKDHAAKTRGKKVRCITTGKEFNSVREAGRYYNCDLHSDMKKIISGKRNYCGKLPDGTPLYWEYID